MLRTLRNQIKAYEAQIRKIMDAHCTIILSVPGIGYVTGASIVGEIGDISRFKSADKLLAFAGLDPAVYQSGNYDANNLKVSKRGSSYLRWALQYCRIDYYSLRPYLCRLLLKKRKEGKHHLVALGPCFKEACSRCLFDSEKQPHLRSPKLISNHINFSMFS